MASAKQLQDVEPHAHHMYCLHEATVPGTHKVTQCPLGFGLWLAKTNGVPVGDEMQISRIFYWPINIACIILIP